MNAAAKSDHRAVCKKVFHEIFHQFNYSVFIPRKDQCDVTLALVPNMAA
jgi:hypothetical protein